MSAIKRRNQSIGLGLTDAILRVEAYTFKYASTLGKQLEIYILYIVKTGEKIKTLVTLIDFNFLDYVVLQWSVKRLFPWGQLKGNCLLGNTDSITNNSQVLFAG